MAVLCMDRHRFDVDPAPNFHVDADPDPDTDPYTDPDTGTSQLSTKIVTLFTRNKTQYIYFYHPHMKKCTLRSLRLC